MLSRPQGAGTRSAARCAERYVAEQLEPRRLLAHDLSLASLLPVPDVVRIGEDVHFAFAVRNAGPDEAQRVLLAFQNIDGLRDVQLSQGSFDPAARVIPLPDVPFFDLGTMPPGSGVVTVSFTWSGGSTGFAEPQFFVATLNEFGGGNGPFDTDYGNNSFDARFIVESVPLVVNTVLDLAPDQDYSTTSLREALTYSNVLQEAAPTPITFAIPGLGRQTLHLTSPLPDVRSPVLIDGYSQPGSHPATPAGQAALPLIELDGAAAGGGANGLRVVGPATVRGLMINRFSGNGIVLDRPGGATIQGCFIGTDTSGADLGNGGHGIWAAGPNNLIGGASAGDANTIAFNGGDGVLVGTVPAVLPPGYAGNGYRNGDIAFDFTGPQQTGGSLALYSLYGRWVVVDFCTMWCVPCRTLTADMVPAVAQLRAEGIDFTYVQVLYEDEPQRVGQPIDVTTAADAAEWSAEFGLAAAGIPLIYGDTAVAISRDWFIARNFGAVPALVFLDPEMRIFRTQEGSPATALIDRVRATSRHFVSTTAPTPGFSSAAGGNSILGNSIFSNDALGIENNARGNPVAAPALSAATAGAASINIAGAFSAAAGAVRRVEFFASPIADPSGAGEGKRFLGAVDVTTNAIGIGNFSALVPAVVPAGQFISATVTDAALGTSAFSTAIPAASANQPPTFTAIANRTITEDSATQTVAITGVSPGPSAADVGQTVSFTASSSNPALISGVTIVGTGASRTLSFKPTANASGAAVITVTADDGQATDHVFSRTFTVTVTPVDDADVGVTMTASPEPVGRLRTLTYAMNVTNNGPEAARDVQLTTQVPAGTTFATIKLSQGIAKAVPVVGAAGAVTIALGSIASKFGTQVVLTVNVTKAAADLLSNSAQVSNSPQDPVATNNAATANVKVVDVGTFGVVTPAGGVRAKSDFVLGLNWTIPDGSWRQLKTVDVRLRDEGGIALWARFDEASDTLSLFNPSSGTFGPQKKLGGPGVLTHAGNQLDVGESTRAAGGPTAPSVLLNLSLRLGPQYVGRRFTIEVAATDDLGNAQPFAAAGTLLVLPGR